MVPNRSLPLLHLYDGLFILALLTILCCEGYPVHCRMFNLNPGLYSLEASSQSLPQPVYVQSWQIKMSLNIAKFSTEGEITFSWEPLIHYILWIYMQQIQDMKCYNRLKQYAIMNNINFIGNKCAIMHLILDGLKSWLENKNIKGTEKI